MIYPETLYRSWTIGLLGLMATACSAPDRGGDAVPPSVGPLESVEARAVVEKVRARFQRAERPSIEMDRAPRSGGAPVLLPSPVERIDLDGAWLRPRMADALPRDVHRASVALPRQASGAFQLLDTRSGMSLEVALAGSTDAPADTAGGLVVYRRGHASGADIIHRPTAEGTEDFLVFDRAPGVEALNYEIVLGAGVAGLRLVERTLELLDENGAPRLRMAPPYLLDSAGARREVHVAVEGCACDVDARPPWGRPVVAPGAGRCTVRVSWAGAEVRYPVLVDPVWTATGSMSVERFRHTASTLADGRVLVAGGLYDFGDISSAEVYDPATSTWSATGSLATARYNHTASVLSNGTVVVAGGFPAHSSAEVYDPAAGTWSLTSPMFAEHSQHTASMLADGRVLVAGGTQPGGIPTSSAEIFDPATNAWSATGALNSARFYHSAGVLMDGRVLVAGGVMAGMEVATAEIFDPVAGTWSMTGSLATARFAHTAAVLTDGRVLVAAGASISLPTVLESAETFDPATGTWSPTGSLATARRDFTAHVLSDGRVLAVGGGASGGVRLASAELFDPATGTWSATGSLNTGRRAHASSMLLNGVVIVAGGEGSTLAVLTSAELFGAANGSACAQPLDCVSSFCAGGVCCDTACAGACEACTVAAGAPQDGTCAPLTGSSCEDSDACTQADTCQAGTCTGTPVVCMAQDECHEAGTCDPQNGCSNPAKPDGAPCTGGTCIAGACTPGGDTGGPGSDSTDQGGCACRSAGEAPAGGLGAVLALSLLLLRRRSGNRRGARTARL